MTMPESEPTLKRYRVGYAMPPKKVSSVFLDPLIDLAAAHGVDLVQIDLDKPLVQQAPFDCVLHKVYGPEWRDQLRGFSDKYQDVHVIDPLDDVEKLHTRTTMLRVVHDLTLPDHFSESLGVPKQIFVECSGGPESESPPSQPLLDRVAEEGLKFPVIAKPLLANGPAESHQMFLVFNADGLNDLKPPFVLQEFVNHGGVLFKVYVAGDHVKCVKRRSLPDVPEQSIASQKDNLIPFSQISDVSSSDDLIDAVELPSSSLVSAMAHELKKGLKLHLFNFDMVRDSKDPNRYLVIDINYFPGYAKIPGYEKMFVDFLLDVLQIGSKKQSGQETAQCSLQEK